MDSWVPNPTDRFENKNGGQENLKIKKKFKFSFSREKVTKKNNRKSRPLVSLGGKMRFGQWGRWLNESKLQNGNNKSSKHSSLSNNLFLGFKTRKF